MRAGRDWGRWPLNVRFGSKADMGLAAVDVRYSPKSGHGLTHFKKRKQHGSRTQKQVNRKTGEQVGLRWYMAEGGSWCS